MQRKEDSLSVYVVERKGSLILVQYLDSSENIQRSVVDESEIIDGCVALAVLENSPSATIDLSGMGAITITPQQIEQAMRGQGLFDESDFSSRKETQAMTAIGREIIKQVKDYIYKSEVESND